LSPTSRYHEHDATRPGQAHFPEAYSTGEHLSLRPLRCYQVAWIVEGKDGVNLLDRLKGL
jgi:hypothetical protein